MKRNATESGDILNSAVSEIRSMSIGAAQEEAILARVKSVLQTGNANAVGEPLAGPSTGKPYLTCCEDFQSLIPEYLSSSLASSRELLLQDHLMECATCWNVFEGGAGKSRVAAGKSVSPAQSISSSKVWVAAAAIAACILLAAVLTQTS